MRERSFGIPEDKDNFNEDEFNTAHKDEIEQYNQSLELPIKDFEAKVNDTGESDKNVEEYFWKIYQQGDKEKIKAALALLEENTLRKKVILEVSEAIAND